MARILWEQKDNYYNRLSYNCCIIIAKVMQLFVAQIKECQASKTKSKLTSENKAIKRLLGNYSSLMVT